MNARGPFGLCDICGKRQCPHQRRVLTHDHLVEAASFTATMLGFLLVALWLVTR